MKLLCISVAMILTFASCGNDPYGPTGYVPETQKPEEKPDEPGKTAGYAEGADISWVTQMEADGQKFYTEDGKEMECTALMKELGLDAIHDTVHEMARDEARHGKALKGLLDRYFG